MRQGAHVITITVLLSLAADAYAGDTGLFRAIPVSIPSKGVLSVTNGTFYSKTNVNNVLIDQYGVESPRILSTVTDFELGVTRSFALTASLPYYADLFSQQGRSGHKAGGGDVSAGFRFSFEKEESAWDRVSLGARVMIPEKFGYGGEPLGFRTFSTGEFGYGIESSARMMSRRAVIHLSGSMYMFPATPKIAAADKNDVFYDTGFGYRGIGKADNTGFAPTVFQNQASVVVNGIVPITRRTAGVLEFGSTFLFGNPNRDDIMRLTPGFHFGSPDGMNLSAGVDLRLRGGIPNKTYLLRVTIPSLSPKDIGRGFGIVKRPPSEREIRAKNVRVAVNRFSKTDFTYLYERDLRESFERELGTMSILAVTSNRISDRAFEKEALVPIKDTSHELGVRLGSSFLINADIYSYRTARTSGFSVPFIISFPQTDYTLSARARVTDLETGKVHELGTITAKVSRKRGTILFPTGPSSDIVQLSVPETRQLEKDLAARWVEMFNARIMERLDLFDWDPKTTPVRGAQDTGG